MASLITNRSISLMIRGSIYERHLLKGKIWNLNINDDDDDDDDAR